MYSVLSLTIAAIGRQYGSIHFENGLLDPLDFLSHRKVCLVPRRLAVRPTPPCHPMVLGNGDHPDPDRKAGSRRRSVPSWHLSKGKG